MGTHCNKHGSHLLLGIAITAMTMPFGLTAAALATTLAGIILVVWQSYSGNAADPQDMALILAGGAAYLLWSRALLPGMGLIA